MKKQHIQLAEKDAKHISDLLSKGSLKASKYKRAMALKLLDSGKTFVEVMTVVGCSYATLLSWRDKYETTGLAFLEDKPRSGRPLEITGLQRAKITALACTQAPEGHDRWTLRLLAEKIVELEFCEQISHNHVGVILKKTR